MLECSMLQNTERKGGKIVAKSKDSNFEMNEDSKKELGKLIKKCRGEKSLRSIAKAINLPPSNLKYIEDGVNAPSPETYAKLIETLCPEAIINEKMDATYMTIRNSPPPDVCEVIRKNQGLNDSLRIIKGHELTAEEIQKLNNLLSSFNKI